MTLDVLEPEESGNKKTADDEAEDNLKFAGQIFLALGAASVADHLFGDDFLIIEVVEEGTHLRLHH